MISRNEIVARFQLRLKEYYDSDVQEVFGYLPSDFQGLSPAMALFVGGTQTEEHTPKLFWDRHLVFLYFVAVYGVKDLPEWDEEKAQQVLGDLFDKLKVFVDDYSREDGFWTKLEFIEFSDVSPVKLAGRPYFMEIVPIVIHSYQEI